MKIVKCIFLGLMTFLFTSCATILTSKHQYIWVSGPKESKIIVNNDTVIPEKRWETVRVTRDTMPLTLKLIQDSIIKSYTIEPSRSFSYWINIGFNAGLGMLVDKNQIRSYAYPKKSYLRIENKSALAYYPMPDKWMKKHTLKWNPTNFLNFLESGPELGYEIASSGKWSTQLMAILILKVGRWREPLMPMGVGLDLERRYYFNENKGRLYVAYELASTLVSCNISEWFYHVYEENDDWGEVYHETFRLKRKTLALNLKWGLQWYLGKNFRLDFAMGLGPKFVDVNHGGRKYPNDKLANNYFLDPYEHYLDRGSRWRLSIPMNMKIGWAF